MSPDDRHRPWPLPKRPWIMKQMWHDLLFIHWPVKEENIRPWVPEPLLLDTFDGQAWIAVVPFHMSGIRPRFFPPSPFASRFPELNVRTYVTLDGKPGVYFFSLDAANALAVRFGRRCYLLPYHTAEMSVRHNSNGICYDSRRRSAAAGEKIFSAEYAPTSDPFQAAEGSLDHWLTERYCLYTHRDGRLYRCEIHHRPWSLQQAKVRIEKNTMLDEYDLCLQEKMPLCHFSKRLDVRVWPLEKIGSRSG